MISALVYSNKAVRKMKFKSVGIVWKLLNDNSILLSGSLMSQRVLDTMKQRLSNKERNEVKVELLSEAEASTMIEHHFISHWISMMDLNGDTGERNIFYDNNGNEWHN